MDALPHVTSLAQVIQLAVAPVFLLAGVGATLNVLASRLGRIIDRARATEDLLSRAAAQSAAHEETQAGLQAAALAATRPALLAAAPAATHVSTEAAFELHQRLGVLSRRASLINRAIALCVLCGLLVSLVVAALFVSSSLRIDLAAPIAIAFVIALLSLAVALVLFLMEVLIATRALSFGGLRQP